MSDRIKELAFGVVVVALLVGGVWFDLSSPDVSVPEEPPAEGARFEARAVFCPPTLAGERVAGNTRFTMGHGSDETIPVTVEPGGEGPSDVPPAGVVTRGAHGGEPANVVGYGAAISASAATIFERPLSGAGAASCATRASDSWFFAGGSSSLDTDQRILIYNPFPDEAVVRIGFYTPRGDQSRAGLSDVAVPAGKWKQVVVNDFILARRVLSTTVTARRGRVVAWRQLFRAPREGARGTDFSLGALDAAEAWYFADGAIGPGVRQEIALLNPGDEEAVVSIAVRTADETIQPQDLTEIALPPASSTSVRLDNIDELPQGRFQGVSAIAQSVNGVEIVAERTTTFATEGLNGSASELGSPTTAERWLVGPPVPRADADALTILNPGAEPAIVSISLLREEGDPIQPEDLRDIEVPGGARVRLSLRDYTDGERVSVLVESDVGVVAERFAAAAAARDVASLLGTPLRRSP